MIKHQEHLLKISLFVYFTPVIYLHCIFIYITSRQIQNKHVRNLFLTPNLEHVPNMIILLNMFALGLNCYMPIHSLNAIDLVAVY